MGNRHTERRKRKRSRLRAKVFTRDAFKCVYCGSEKELTLEHVVPRSLGGNSTEANLITACMLCNTQRGSKELTKVQKERARQSLLRCDVFIDL